MKKTYAAPTIITNGGVVAETLSGFPSGPETPLQALTAGRVGFDL